MATKKTQKQVREVSKNQTNAARKSSGRKTYELKVEPGEYDVPGGKLIINDKGLTNYVGTPYHPVTIKKKYRMNAPDRGPDGKVKERLGKGGK